ncbi:MAG: DNA internalization-related competence protein ComEC/Rec2 [Lysobacter sp.]|nr:MAG: DNA internalization-related competence protein ComEC/Rec2 [Lysobacter sp.]
MDAAARTPLLTPINAVALLTGIGACLALPFVPPSGALALLLAAAAVATLRLRRIGPMSIFVFGFVWAALQAGHALRQQLPASPPHLDMVVVGQVVSLPRIEPRRIAFDVVVHETPSRLDGRTVRIAWYPRRGEAPPSVHAGERWRFPLRLRAPRGLRNPSGSDSEKHAFADRLAATGYVRGGVPVRLQAASGIAGWRDVTSRRIEAAIGTRTSRFIRALALGDTRFLDDADWTILRADGLTHLIAISGFHVGMVAGFLALLVRLAWWLLPALARHIPARIAAAGAGVAGATVYAAASGFAIPTVRTLLMIAVVAGAQCARRSIAMPTVLAMAAIAILLVDPLAVLSAGFWLSFLGVVWLLWCMPSRGGSALGNLARAQGVATVGLLPLTVVLFGQASLVGPVANLVAVPWWSLVVAPLSVAGIALDALHPTLGGVAWRLAAWCFDIAWPLFERLGSSAWALWYLPEGSMLALPLALAGAFWMMLPRGVPGKPLALLLWLPLLWPDPHRPPPGALEVTVIDVGQGLSVLVRTRTHTLLYDAGPAMPDGFDAGERAVIPTLHARGVRRLDRILISHADADHAGGLAAVQREVPSASLAAPEGSGIDGARPCLAGESWSWNGVRFRLLHPPPLFPYLANDSSCVLRIEGRHGSVLLAGDISSLVEERLVAADPASLRADLVMVTHHGSRHSSSPAFIAATGARDAVFSTGHANRFRHPNEEVVARWSATGARLWNTADQGALTFLLGPGGVTASARRRTASRLWDATHRPGATAGLSYRGD